MPEEFRKFSGKDAKLQRNTSEYKGNIKPIQSDDGRAVLCSSASLRETAFALMTENEISKIAVDAAFKIHTTLGPGLLESVYDSILAYELENRGLAVTRQQAIPVVYDRVKLDLGFRADLIVNGKVVVEVKSIEVIAPVHAKQLRTYLRLMDLKLGLLINFNVNLIKEGITRVVNNL